MFLNLVVENAFEELGGGVRKPLGMIVSVLSLYRCVVRGSLSARLYLAV